MWILLRGVLCATEIILRELFSGKSKETTSLRSVFLIMLSGREMIEHVFSWSTKVQQTGVVKEPNRRLL